MNAKPLVDLAKKAGPFLKELADTFFESLIQDLKSGKINYETVRDQFLNPQLAKADIKVIDIDYLTPDKLVQNIKDNTVPDSNEVAALLRKSRKKNYLYTAFLKDGELLPVENNKYLIIVADAIARDLENQFDGNELIVLR